MSSSNYYKFLFSRFYDPFMHSIEMKELTHRRKRLLSPLDGTILEIGSGTGINLPFYSTNTKVFALEPNPHMWEIIEKKRHYTCNLEPIVKGIEDPEVQMRFTEPFFDSVVCTLVLCNVPDLRNTFRFIEKVLKVGGKLVLLEHIRSHSNFSAGIQDFFSPSWKFFADGCNLNRETDKVVKEFDFKLEWEEYFSISLPFYSAIYEKQ